MSKGWRELGKNLAKEMLTLPALNDYVTGKVLRGGGGSNSEK